MEHIRLTAISLSLLLCTVSAFAQRHYENIPALELNYGTNLFGNAGNYYNLSFSRYINRTSYWKAGFSYFEKPYEYTANLPQVSTLNPEETIPETIHDKGKDFFVDGGYYRTLACNLKSVYWGIAWEDSSVQNTSATPIRNTTSSSARNWKRNWKYSSCPERHCLPAYNNIGIPYPLTSGTLSGT